MKKYILFNKNIPILLFDMDELSGNINKIHDIYNLKYLPISVYTKDDKVERSLLLNWWKNRSIPASRKNIEELLQKLRLPNAQILVQRSFGLSLTDQYWICPENLDIQWKDINFFNHAFTDELGEYLCETKNIENAETILSIRTPSATSDGWLPKKWKIINGKRILLKTGSGVYEQEPLNEVIATYLLSKNPQFDYVPYTTMMDKGMYYSACPCFIGPDEEFVPAYHLYVTKKQENHISNYDHFINCCNSYGIQGVENYLDFQIALDYIIGNVDRHLNNFGFIRDVNTLDITRIAPIFDNGTSLWHNTRTDRINPREDIKAKPFYTSQRKQLSKITSLESLNLDAFLVASKELYPIMELNSDLPEERIHRIQKGIEIRTELLEKEWMKEHTHSYRIGNNDKSALLSTEEEISAKFNDAKKMINSEILEDIKERKGNSDESLDDIISHYKKER